MSSTDLSSDDFFTAYRSYEDICMALDALSESRSSVSVTTLGRSCEGRDVRSVCLTNAASTAPKRQLVVDAGYRACEWASIATCLYLVKKLVDSPLLDRCEIHFIPVVNPDGHECTWSSDRLWRKNRSPTKGTDLQRNFDFHWGETSSRPSPDSPSYQGRSAASEIEVVNMQSFFAGLTSFNGYVNLGWGAGAILSPWAWTTDESPDQATQSGMAATMQAAIAAAGDASYDVNTMANNFHESGGSLDYVYGVRRVVHAYHVSPPDHGLGVTFPASRLLTLAEPVFAGVNALFTALCG